jgi:phosphatidylserine decarboxylase
MTFLYVALGAAAFVVFAVWFVKHVWFYRDPPRGAPLDARLVRSPCDGQVMYVRPVEKGEIFSDKLGQKIALREITHADWEAAGAPEEGWIIGIYMSPLDVHFNYAPASCRIERIFRTDAKLNLPMVDTWEYLNMTWLRRVVDLMGRRFHLENERQTLFLSMPGLRLAMVEIADKFVNKIHTFVDEGEDLRQGQKVAFISRGSQVDVVLFRRDLELLVKPGDQTYGAETPLARVPAPPVEHG